ncbi:MAG: metallophosphoesterase [Gemmatimonadales bacterium]|nr:MAG: metallophosphoesterase [Gemmatimonadales bacterium]
MRIGLIGDTHGYLRAEVFKLFRGVDHILHAGDVGTPDILTDLQTIAPVTAVWGNTDGFDVRACTVGEAEVELGGVCFALAHGHRVAEFNQLADVFPRAVAIVHGHSHVPRNDLVNSVRMLNPGSAGPGGVGWAPSVAIVEIQDGAINVVHLDVATGSTLHI